MPPVNNVQTTNKYVPDYLVTPGEVLEDYLGYAGITQDEFANRTGLSKKTINEIVKAKSAITAEIALKFERTLSRPVHFWSNLRSSKVVISSYFSEVMYTSERKLSLLYSV